jgi:hypothetical protein
MTAARRDAGTWCAGQYAAAERPLSKDRAGFALVARQHEARRILDKHASYGASDKKNGADYTGSSNQSM